jgi:hypothetical protein
VGRTEFSANRVAAKIIGCASDQRVLRHDGNLIAGSLPRRALALVAEWAALHQEELIANWARARREESLRAIDPLT